MLSPTTKQLQECLQLLLQSRDQKSIDVFSKDIVAFYVETSKSKSQLVKFYINSAANQPKTLLSACELTQKTQFSLHLSYYDYLKLFKAA